MAITDVPRWGLGSFQPSTGRAYAGLVVDDRVAAITQVLGREVTVADLLRDWAQARPQLDQAAAAVDTSTLPRTAELRPLPPVQPPGQLFCAGANYKQHVKQLVAAAAEPRAREASAAEAERMIDERAASGRPYVFLGLPTAMAGANDDVVLPEDARQPDWELELAVVIGRPAYRVSREDSLAHVAGYCICNDVTLRDRVFRRDMPSIGTDWLAGKNGPTMYPIGPWITPAHLIDPAQLRLTLRLNGEIMQDETTADMLFGIPDLIAHASAHAALAPGDTLLTGSPAGNGAHHNRYLAPGDVMEAEIEGLGGLRNRCVAGPADTNA